MSETTTDLLHERFEILRKLGQGGQAQTFLARDVQTGHEVAIKELAMHHAADWKAIELFEREGKALQNLDHRAVPAYVDAFHLEDGARFFLVQEYIDGESLEARVKRGELMDEAEARRFLLEMLEILDYLHDLSPPVVHRDIKPSNILLRPDGSYALIDFGAVQAVSPDAVGGSTIVGTTGYMPPEQLMGRATPSTDLYALAATTVHVVTGIHPADLPMRRMKLDFADIAGLSAPLTAVLDRMLEPDVSGRFGSAEEVREALERGAPARPASAGAMVASPRARELVDKCPAFDPVTTVRLEGDTLRVEADVHKGKTPIKLALGIAAVGLVMVILGCATGLGGLVCPGMAVLLIGPWLAPVLKKGLAGAASQHLMISSRGVDLLEGKLDPNTGDLLPEKQMHIPLTEVRNVYLHVIDGQMMEQAQQGGGGMPAHLFQKPGIVFVDSRNGRHTFGTSVITRGKLVSSGLPDTTEIRWLYDIVVAHLQGLAGGGDDGGDLPPGAW